MRHIVQASALEELIAELQTDVTGVVAHPLDPVEPPPLPPLPPVPPVPVVGAFTQTRGAPTPVPLQTKPLGHSPLSEHWVLPLWKFGEQLTKRIRSVKLLGFISSSPV
jgi:hypothetical protein